LPLCPSPLQNAEQQGPEHATKHVWVVKPALRERFGLPTELPSEVQEKLAASVKAPKQKKAAKQLGELGGQALLLATPVAWAGVRAGDGRVPATGLLGVVGCCMGQAAGPAPSEGCSRCNSGAVCGSGMAPSIYSC